MSHCSYIWGSKEKRVQVVEFEYREMNVWVLIKIKHSFACWWAIVTNLERGREAIKLKTKEMALVAKCLNLLFLLVFSSFSPALPLPSSEKQTIHVYSKCPFRVRTASSNQNSRTIFRFSRTENYFYFYSENEAVNTHEGGGLERNCQITFRYLLRFVSTVVLINMKNTLLHCFKLSWVMYYLEIEGLLSQFKEFWRLYANSRTFQDKQSKFKCFSRLHEPCL